MNSRIYSHKDLIGTACLQLGDESMGGLFGEFQPNDKYFEMVQGTFRKFWENQNPNYNKIESLRLNVQLENDYFLFPAGGITIEDSEEFPRVAKIINVAGLRRKVFDEFLGQPILPAFIEIPWNPISIEEKIALENQLNIELGVNNTTFKIFKSKKEDHVLTYYEISAISRDQRNDDVLFAIRKSESDYQFAVVHLTWKNEKERSGYPGTKLYRDFFEFKNTRLKADIADWN